MKFLVLSLSLLLSSLVQSQEISIIPLPKKLEMPATPGKFSISSSTQLVLEGSNMSNSVNFFNDYLQRFYGFKLGTVNNSSGKNVIRLNFERMDNAVAGAYRMTVDDKGVYIAGDNEDGVFYGVQTLLQLLPVPESATAAKAAKLDIPYVTIEDAPRFAYRGLHLDVGRHFMPVDFIKRYIDYIALHKMNYFHWHLTEDQGWRIEIKKYPKLTQVGAFRNGTIVGRYPGSSNDSIRYGGFYTQEQVKDIVAYAQKRYITIIPEIEMPGHSSAAIAAYPELSCFPEYATEIGNQTPWSGARSGKQVQQTWGVFDDVFCAGKENTFQFLQDVLEEVLALFPSKYVHVGGDECPKKYWQKCEHCQKRIRDNKLKDEHELQSYFIQRIEKYLNGKGRSLIGWDEILEGGLAPKAIVMSWRGEAGGIEAAKQKHEVIMTPGNPVYFDHSQSENEDSVTIGGFNPVEKVYAYEPIPAALNAEQAKYVLGAQANVWTEYMKNPSKVEYMLFPRLSALSEVLWSPKEKRDFENFSSRLFTQFKRYDLWKNRYSKALMEIKSTITAPYNARGILWKLSTNLPKASIQFSKKPEANDPPNPAPFNPYTEPVNISTSGEYNAWLTLNGKRLEPTLTQRFQINKATGKTISLLTEGVSPRFPGSGPFTLLDGIRNEKGMARSREFLGYAGVDCNVLINLEREDSISSLKVYTFEDKKLRAWRSAGVVIQSSQDGQKFTPVVCKSPAITGEYTLCEFEQPVKAKYFKVQVKNHGIIDPGNPGAGTVAFLLLHEIEMK